MSWVVSVNTVWVVMGGLKLSIENYKYKSMRKEFLKYIIISLCAIWSSSGVLINAQIQKTLIGRVIDSRSRKGLADVNISLKGTNIGTVTNSEGKFSLYITDAQNAVVTFSTLGYASVSIAADELEGKGNLVRMVRQPVELSEVVVYSGDPENIIQAAIRKIPENYSVNKDLLSMFYRETIRKGKRFIGVSEAAINVFKTPYNRRIVSFDRVQIERGRRIISQKTIDTLAVKIMGGPNLAVNLDIVKNPDVLFAEQDLPDFDFKMEKPEYLDDRLQFVISFKPRVKRDYVQFKGKIYVDQETLSFTRSEFEMINDDKAKMTAALVQKKPRGLIFTPQKILFTVSYKFIDGKTYLNYICNEMRFKCDMKRRLFSSAYTTFSEMVVVDRQDNTDEKITYKKAFKPGQVFYDIVDEYWDADYWSDFNIIEPTESLEKAVEKLKR